MFQRRILTEIIVLFNVLIVLGFVFSNFYIWNFFNTQIDQGITYNGQGGYSIPYIEDFGLQVSVSHPFYENGTIVNLGSTPTAVPNYPFILFWVAIVGNLLFILILLRNKKQNAGSFDYS